MALNDYGIHQSLGLKGPSSVTFRVAASATTIKAGEPVNVSGSYVLAMVDATPVVGTSAMLGIASTTSTNTATADGTVEVMVLNSNIIFEAPAKSAAAVDTDAELLALLNKNALIDFTSGEYTIDTAVAATGGTNGIKIVGGDPSTGMLYCMLRNTASDLS